MINSITMSSWTQLTVVLSPTHQTLSQINCSLNITHNYIDLYLIVHKESMVLPYLSHMKTIHSQTDPTPQPTQKYLLNTQHNTIIHLVFFFSIRLGSKFTLPIAQNTVSNNSSQIQSIVHYYKSNYYTNNTYY